MQNKTSFKWRSANFAVAVLFASALCLTSAAFAQTETILYNFSQSGNGGWWPDTLALDSAGNLYGANIYGGGYTSSALPFGGGSVFQLSPNASGGYSYNLLYDFPGGADGSYPIGVNFGPDGSLYGVTESGGNLSGCNCGTLYKLTAPASGTGPWTKTILHNFAGGSDGSSPDGQLFFDSAGNIYGATSSGGEPYGFGVFFELSPSSSGVYTEQILFEFPTGTKGSPAYLIQNPAGGYYGITDSPGNRYFPGVVFQLAQNSSGIWQETVLHTFNETTPGALVLTPSGSLIGITNETTECMFCGNVYELTPSSGGTWTYTKLASFDGGKAGASVSAVAVDAAGTIYGTAYEAGPMKNGFVFQLTQSGGVWIETDIHDFNPKVGDGSIAGPLVLDNSGNIYGATYYGGTHEIGVLYKLTM